MPICPSIHIICPDCKKGCLASQDNMRNRCECSCCGKVWDVTVTEYKTTKVELNESL